MLAVTLLVVGIVGLVTVLPLLLVNRFLNAVTSTDEVEESRIALGESVASTFEFARRAARSDPFAA